MQRRVDLVDLAKKYATKFHKEQFRKDGKTPFIKHPRAVVKKLKKDFGITDEYILAGAWLHDVVEYGGDLDDIQKIFGGNIADKVNLLTNWASYGSEVDFILYTMKLQYNAPSEVKLIKYCDVLVNLEESKNIKMTKKEKEIYRKKKNMMIKKIKPDILPYIEKIEI